MSKIGRKPIPVTSAQVKIENNQVFIKGPKAEFTHSLPSSILAVQKDGSLVLSVQENTRKNRTLWGLHRAILANKIQGAEVGFEKKVNIVGLGYKAQKSGDKLVLTLGYSHKVDYELPQGVTVDIDKSGQNLIFKSHDKFLLGNACDKMRFHKPPEPYKGTGILVEGRRVIRKAGKTKGA